MRLLVVISLFFHCSVCFAEDLGERFHKPLTAKQDADQKPVDNASRSGFMDNSEMGDRGLNESQQSKTSFYGIDATGSRFAFVCDISGSMEGMKFIRLMQQLQTAINKLPPKAKFYIIFFGDTHFPLFYPNTVHQMVPATAANKMKVQNWLSKVVISGGTYAFNAIKMAFKMEPDTMFLLSDGVFSDHLEVANAFDSIRGQKTTRVHTVSIGQPSNFLRRIAEFNNGTYQEILQ